ncbi:MAG: hypothetical protein AB3N13_11300 [Arenibacterium sp.]
MKLFATVVALVFGASMASAAAYNMFDHPKGGKASSYDYGLRMEAAPGSGADDYWSFETTAGKSRVVLDVNIADGTGTVSGLMRHNKDDSDWILDLTLTGVVSLAGIGAGADSFGATKWSGTLSKGSTVYNLLGKAKDIKGTGYEWTYFSQDPGGEDWRAPNISAGWVGSLDGGASMTRGTNDFIGTMSPVPIPAAGLMLLSALGLLGLRRRFA